MIHSLSSAWSQSQPRSRHFERSLRSEKCLCSFCHPVYPEPRRDRTLAPFADRPLCHPDRSGPILSSAPNCGASGCEVEGPAHSPRQAHAVIPTEGSRLMRAAVEGSRHNPSVLPRFSNFPSPSPDRCSPITFPLAPIALQYIALRHIPRTQPAGGTISLGGSNTGYL